MADEKTNKRTGDKIAISGDYQYHAYYHASAPQRFWHRFKLFTAIANLPAGSGKQLLDAGCGSGMLAGLLATENPEVHITGIDGNKDAVDFCNRQWKHLTNTVFFETQIDDLSRISHNSIDGIAFLEVIEHLTLQQASEVLKAFYRVLKPKGVLVISTPNRKSLWPALEKLLDLLRLVPRLQGDQHEKIFSGRELAAIVEQAGFITSRKQTINAIAPWLAILSERLAIKIHNWELRQHWIPGSLLVYTFTKP